MRAQVREHNCTGHFATIVYQMQYAKGSRMESASSIDKQDKDFRLNSRNEYYGNYDIPTAETAYFPMHCLI